AVEARAAVPGVTPMPVKPASGRKGSRAPPATPTSIIRAHAASIRPTAFQAWRPGPEPAGSASKAPIITALHRASRAQPSIFTQAGNRDETIHQAVASSNMPKPHFTPSIHAPALG